MIIEWQAGAYSQYQNYYGMGTVLNWSSAGVFGRILKVIAITTQYRQVQAITTQYRLVQSITCQYRKVVSITTQYRLVSAITTLYRKVRTITTGG